MTITYYDKFAFLPKRCSKCNRLFIFEEYNIYYKMAAKDVGLKSGAHIRDVCRGERKTAGKYYWKYTEVN